MSTATPHAVLFDIDGTLVDSNYLHVEAWVRAFADAGIAVDTWRIHRMIGMDSSFVLDDVLGSRVAELGDEVKRRNAEYYLGMSDRVRVFEGARDLIRELTERGVRVTLATSAPADELEILLRVLDVEELLTAVTSSEDVETAKPRPDVVQVALERSGTAPEDTVFVGDSAWDAVAATRAGVECVGVLSGGFGAAELREAGASAVVDDVSALRAGLDSGPLARLLRD